MSDRDRPTGNYTKDPRVDRAVTWALTAFAGVALMVGAWFCRELNQTVSDLSATVGELRTAIAVAQVERGEIGVLRGDLKELTKRVDALERAR